MSDDLYRQQLLELYNYPLNYGELVAPTFRHQDDNPLCGDTVQIDVCLDENERVCDVRWQGDGCAISQVSASLLTEAIKGLSLTQVRAFSSEQLLALLGISLTATRLKCAMLSLRVLHAGAEQVQQREGEQSA